MHGLLFSNKTVSDNISDPLSSGHLFNYACTIGLTSRATFGIPAKRLNITIYPILGESLLKKSYSSPRFSALFQLLQFRKPSVHGIEWDIL